MKFRTLLLACVVATIASQLTSCAVANSLGGYASRVGDALGRAVR